MTSECVVGRDPEIALLISALAEVTNGGGARTVVFSARAGVGKSSLLQEAVRRACELGAVVLEGGCVSIVGIADLNGPYSPFVEAFAGVPATSPARLQRRFAAWSEAGFPGPKADTPVRPVDEVSSAELTGRLPAYVDAARVDPAQARHALARSLLGELAARAPVLLCLDDVHWADRSSLALIVALARSMPARVLMVLAARPTQDAANALTPEGATAFEALDHLRRRPGVTWCDLPPLPDAIITEIARSASQRPLKGPAAGSPAALAPERIFEITALAEGVPLVAVELAAADGNRRVPRSVAASVASVWRSLEDSTREAVSAAAVLGTITVLSDVASVLGREPGQELQQAAARGLLQATDLGYAFGHIVDREAVLGLLAPHLRMNLHTRCADLLERQARDLPPGAAATALARASSHRVGAGDGAALVSTAIRASTASAELGAYPEAFAQARMALRAWPTTEDVDARNALLLDAAEFARWAAEPHVGLELVREALRIPSCAEEPLLWERRGHLSREIGDLEEARMAYERAQALVEDTKTSARTDVAVRARVLAGVASLRLTGNDLSGAQAVCRTALSLSGLPGPERASLLITSGVVEALTEDPERGLASLRAGRDLARRSGAEREVWRYVGNAMFVLQNLDRSMEAMALGLGEVERARRAGVVGSLAVLPVINNLASTLLTVGCWQEVIDLTGGALASGPPVAPEAMLCLARGEASLHRGDLLAAGTDVRRAHEALSALPSGLAVRVHRVRAEVAAASADLAAGRAAVDAALGLLEVAEDPDAAIEVLMVAVSLEADCPPAVRASTRLSDYDHLLAQATTLLQDLPSGAAHMEAAICAAELARGREQRDPERWAELGDRSRDLGHPHLHARCRLRESEARLAARDRTGAAPLLREATAIAEKIGDALLEEAARALARSYRLSIPEAAVPRRSVEVPPGAEALGLTPRECQALTGLLQGRSNRQIGRGLGISEKTASVHVSNVIRKLGVSTRAEAAAYAHHQHLLD